MSSDAWHGPGRSAASIWGWRLLMGLALAVSVVIVGAVLTMLQARPPLPPGSAPAQAPAVSAAGDATAGPPPDPAGSLAPAPSSPTSRVDSAWAARIAAATGIPVRALIAYASADLIVDAESPTCGIGWNTLAGIGAIESDHGAHGDSVLNDSGYPEPSIRGLPLDGNGVAAIPDTDGGAWDGDSVWDRAVGPMQFIPDTWVRWGADGNGDGRADPNQIDDAALAAARYLCASGPMTSVEGWRAAIFSYNHLDTYVDDVAVTANRYAQAVR